MEESKKFPRRAALWILRTFIWSVVAVLLSILLYDKFRPKCPFGDGKRGHRLTWKNLPGSVYNNKCVFIPVDKSGKFIGWTDGVHVWSTGE